MLYAIYSILLEEDNKRLILALRVTMIGLNGPVAWRQGAVFVL
ncbi:MAG: hypothetical protein WCS37_06315 [Chloroflexota bacterium]